MIEFFNLFYIPYFSSMKTIPQNIASRLIPLVIVPFIIFSLLVMPLYSSAQIPQNIEVDGEASNISSYVYYVLALLVFVLVVIILGKFFRKKD